MIAVHLRQPASSSACVASDVASNHAGGTTESRPRVGLYQGKLEGASCGFPPGWATTDLQKFGTSRCWFGATWHFQPSPDVMSWCRKNAGVIQKRMKGLAALSRGQTLPLSTAQLVAHKASFASVSKFVSQSLLHDDRGKEGRQSSPTFSNMPGSFQASVNHDGNIRREREFPSLPFDWIPFVSGEEENKKQEVQTTYTKSG